MNARLTRPWLFPLLAAFEEFAVKFPDIYAVHLNIGSAFMKKGDLDRAEAEFKSVLDKNGPAPEDLRKQKDTSLKALENLKKFLELDPQNPEAPGVKAAIAAIEKIKS